MTSGSPRVLQITESLNVTHGGQAVACARLADHLAAAGAVVSLATIDGGSDDARVPLDSRVESIRCVPTGPAWFRFSTALGATLERVSPSLVHVHGLWRMYLQQAASFTERRGLPLIVSTHGMLHAPARRQRGTLKSLARRLGQDRILRNAACLHATAAEEAHEIRKLGIDTPVAVIPWGVDAPSEAPARSYAASRTVVFLGRYHPTKGIEPLLRAWARIAGRFPSARLRLAGYDDDGFRAQFQRQAGALGVSGSVTFAGPVEGVARERLFAEADLLILPSPSENFGLVVPEALVRGVPVITTQGTPWPALAEQRCGWWVPATDDALAGALGEALDAPPAVLSEMSARGRRYAGATFAWNRVAASMLELYAWTLGRTGVPSFVDR